MSRGKRFDSARRLSLSADLQGKPKAMPLPNLTWGSAYGNPFDTGCSVQHWRCDHGRMSAESLRALGLCLHGWIDEGIATVELVCA
jgi:hypothetical protein